MTLYLPRSTNFLNTFTQYNTVYGCFYFRFELNAWSSLTFEYVYKRMRPDAEMRWWKWWRCSEIRCDGNGTSESLEMAGDLLTKTLEISRFASFIFYFLSHLFFILIHSWPFLRTIVYGILPSHKYDLLFLRYMYVPRNTDGKFTCTGHS